MLIPIILILVATIAYYYYKINNDYDGEQCPRCGSNHTAKFKKNDKNIYECERCGKAWND